jgi:GTP-binding protein
MAKLNNVKYYKTVIDASELEESLAEVAFVGRSNVGKSSVLNYVCGEKKLAYISQVPGKTRSINVFEAARGRWIVDLPGYGFAVGPEEERLKWQEMIENYLLGRENLKMVFMIVDANVGPTKLDKQMAFWLQANCLPYSIVANKIDKISSLKIKERLQFAANELQVVPEKLFPVSATKGTGMKELAAEIRTHISI